MNSLEPNSMQGFNWSQFQDTMAKLAADPELRKKMAEEMMAESPGCHVFINPLGIANISYPMHITDSCTLQHEPLVVKSKDAEETKPSSENPSGITGETGYLDFFGDQS